MKNEKVIIYLNLMVLTAILAEYSSYAVKRGIINPYIALIWQTKWTENDGLVRFYSKYL